ncbi:hypothetical protein IWW34DRAFT_841429 [Fusarium oxysporum f. sp. albedinis]|nr:hypothetical protein FOMA001_g70 [Fusarium oxysporum f. sp. matthiolae]KAI3585682.1 hypothetical protein IWW34DRAFT_841429 [Fusarium oxysporum f. sp. albedinis]
MTTNSFGGPLPPFDFPAQPAPAVSRMARVSKALPIVLVTASVVAVAVKTSQEPNAFRRPSVAQDLVPQGQGIVDKRNVEVGLKPNE